MDRFSLTDIKKKNLSDVFHYIYGNPGCAKQTIANALTISLPTVSQHLTTLLEEGLIEKSGQLSSNIGRKAMGYSAVPSARIAVGIEILTDTVYIVAINLYGHKEAKEKLRLSFHADDFYFQALRDAVFSFLNKYHFKEEQILGIGLGVQGLVTQDGKTVTYGKTLDFTGLSIDIFQKYFPYPCYFIHDSECAANTELWENPDIRDAIYISLGRHLGGAIILDGRLQNGTTGKSGTFEHMTLIPGGKTCYCGRKGCAECYCSGKSLLSPHQELEDFFSQKAQGDPAANEKWTVYLDYLALLINNLHMVMENTVILGGHVTTYFTEEDLDLLQKKISDLSTWDTPSYILVGRCRIDAVSIGAALPLIRGFLQSMAKSAD